MIRKHKDYEYTKRSRTFLCGLDSNDYSEYALEWLIDELVDDGDEIVCLQVVEKGDKVAGESSIDHGRYRAEAEKLMDRIQMKNTENKAVNLILEFSVGTVHKVIDEMVCSVLYLALACPYAYSIADQPTRTSNSHCGNAWSKSRWLSRAASRIRLQVLPSTFARARYRG